MNVRVGLGFGGPVFGGGGGAASRTALGAPSWGPNALLRDLELRLGLPPVVEASSARIPRWAARIKSLADEGAFYARSFAVDELGTAAALLDWRDALVEAGWDGRPIPRGGARLDALAAIEAHEPAGMPLGRADAVARVDRVLATAPSRLYESIALAEDAALWPGRWRSIFRHLEARGTALTRLAVELSGAPDETDLGLAQARLRGERRAGALRGDGTVLCLLGDTPGDLAELTASLLAKRSGRLDVVVRCHDPAPLEAALGRHGLAPQGCATASAWRPAMQLLALAVELAFEPRDPFRVLELLTLPVGPFRGSVGARLARAVARQPGIGGKEWSHQKEELTRRLHERYAREERARGASDTEAEARARELVEARWEVVAAWLEGEGADRRGARRVDLIAVVERVRAWLGGRLRGGDPEVYGAAYAQASALAEALASETREVLSQEDARQLVDRFARTEQTCSLSVEAAGRIAHVQHPAALLAPADGVFLWGFVSGTERRPPRIPWNDEERAALERAGVAFPDASALLRAEAERWRRAVLAAKERVVFVVPRTIKGAATAPHPLWDEIRARLRLDDTGVAAISRGVRRLLDEGASDGLAPIAPCARLRLPEARAMWRAPGDLLRRSVEAMSVTSLETIASCPLRWVLERRAALRSGAVSRVATGPLLNGNLSHRLVEELHAEGAFDLPEGAFLERARERFDALLRAEGATLLLPGASIERFQLTRQVREAMRALYRYLAASGRRIAGVEEPVEVDSAIGPLRGRLDVRLVDDEGRSAILDLKWGASSYRARLAEGSAVQLAAYARALARLGEAPPAAYFAVRSGEVLSTDPRMNARRPVEGPSLEETWRRVGATAGAVMKSHAAGEVHVSGTKRHAAGEVHVSGTKRRRTLLDALGVPEADRDRYFEAKKDAACEYCEYDALCGRKWEALS